MPPLKEKTEGEKKPAVYYFAKARNQKKKKRKAKFDQNSTLPQRF